MLNVDPKFIEYQLRSSPARNWVTVSEQDYKQSGFEKRRLAVMPEHHITARGWRDKHGWHYVAELREVQSGNVIIELSLYGCRDDWMRAIAERMSDQMADVFPAFDNRHIPSIWFREVCNVPYDFREVSRKKDL